MNELLFAVLGAVSVFFVAVPMLTLVARMVAERLEPGRQGGRLLLVTGPTLGPVLWFLSAAIHQSERSTPVSACSVDHLGGELCPDIVWFGALLLSVLSYAVLRRGGAGAGLGARVQPEQQADRAHIEARIETICARYQSLRAYRTRVRIVATGAAPACVRGLWWPRIELASALATKLDDDELAAALLHEVEHLRGRDPLRFFVAQVALSINPLAFLLADEFARYCLVREVACDKRAVQCGAHPLSLARSIVAAATPAPLMGAVAPLGGHGIGGVRLRVQLLLGYAACGAGAAPRATPVGLGTVLLILLALSPHIAGAGPLDQLHLMIEHTAVLLGVG